MVIKQEFKALTWEEKNDITASETELLQAAMLKARLVCCWTLLKQAAMPSSVSWHGNGDRSACWLWQGPLQP